MTEKKRSPNNIWLIGTDRRQHRQTKQKFGLPTMVARHEKFQNQFIEDLQRIANLNNLND